MAVQGNRGHGDTVVVARQGGHQPPARHVPEAQRLVVRPGQQLAAVRCEAAAGHDVAVARQRFPLALAAEAEVPQDHVAVPRGGRQRLAVLRVDDGGDRPRVGQEDCQPALRHAVPGGQQAVHGAGDPPFSVW